MSSSLKWNDAYKVGNVLLDEQHKSLLELSGRASWLLASASVSRKDFHDLLNSFVELVREHFDAEERALASNGYPDLAKHVSEHDAFRLMLANLQLDAHKGQFFRNVLLALIADYTDRHLLNADLACKEYLKAH